MAVIAIDLGTTGCKAAVFEGPKILGSAYCHYPYQSPREGWAEQDAAGVWLLINQVVKESLQRAGNPFRVGAICVSVQGDAIIPIDAAGRPLHPAILGMDIRSHQEAADLQNHFGRGPLYAATGMPCEPLNAITKVLWLKRQVADLEKRVWKYVHYEDYLLMKIAGVPALSISMASRTMAFDPVRKDWHLPVLEFCGLTPAQMGNVAPSGAPVGIILRSLAEEWAINRNALVIAGGHDQCMAAIGAGVIESDMACYSMGTAEVMGICFESPQLTSSMLGANYPCYCHAAAPLYFTISLNQSGGLSLDWFQKNILASAELGDAEQNALSEKLFGGLALEPSPVLFLPHIVGSGTPTCDHLSRGAFIGMSLKSRQTDLFQAVADALAFEARVNLEMLETLGIPVNQLRAVGGGARSRTLLELKATVLNRPISTLKNSEAALLGCALLAEVATGEFSDLSTACRECVELESTVEPRPEALAQYDAAFIRFRQLYGTMRSFYHNWRAEWQ